MGTNICIENGVRRACVNVTVGVFQEMKRRVFRVFEKKKPSAFRCHENVVHLLAYPKRGCFRLPFAVMLMMTYKRKKSIDWPSLEHKKKRPSNPSLGPAKVISSRSTIKKPKSNIREAYYLSHKTRSIEIWERMPKTFENSWLPHFTSIYAKKEKQMQIYTRGWLISTDLVDDVQSTNTDKSIVQIDWDFNFRKPLHLRILSFETILYCFS